MKTNTETKDGMGGKVGNPDVARKKGRKRNWRKAFLAAFRQIGVVAPAAAAAGVSRTAVRMATLRDPDFAAQYAEALDESTERLEAMAFARAADAKKPSDLLMIFLLKARKPKVYRENLRVETTGADGGPIQQNVEGTVVVLPGEDFEAKAAEYVAQNATTLHHAPAGAADSVPPLPS